MSHVISAWRLLKAGVGVEQHRITNSTPSKTSHVIPAKTISSGLRPASQSDLKWPGLSPTLPWTSQHPVRPHRQIGCTCHDISRSPKSRIRRRLTRTVNALLTIFGDFLDAAPPAVFLTRVGRLARPASTAPRVQWHQNRNKTWTVSARPLSRSNRARRDVHRLAYSSQNFDSSVAPQSRHLFSIRLFC